MWVPLTNFTDYRETVFSIENQWVFSFMSSFSHKSKVDFSKFGRPFVPYFWEWVIG